MREFISYTAANLAARILTRSLALAGFGIYLSGCAQLGPDLVKAGRNDYNIMLQQTEDEELILNLVRVRYGDRPLFLDVNSVLDWSIGKINDTSSENKKSGHTDFDRATDNQRGDPSLGAGRHNDPTK